jgi:hypothetical protein
MLHQGIATCRIGPEDCNNLPIAFTSQPNEPLQPAFRLRNTHKRYPCTFSPRCASTLFHIRTRGEERYIITLFEPFFVPKYTVLTFWYVYNISSLSPGTWWARLPTGQ